MDIGHTRGRVEVLRAPVDCTGVSLILHDASVLPPGDTDLLEMVQDTFDRARQVMSPADARTYIRVREEELYRHLEALGHEDRVPRVRAVYAAFWRLNAGV
jgi:hypothetical protein